MKIDKQDAVPNNNIINNITLNGNQDFEDDYDSYRINVSDNDQNVIPYEVINELGNEECNILKNNALQEINYNDVFNLNYLMKLNKVQSIDDSILSGNLNVLL